MKSSKTKFFYLLNYLSTSDVLAPRLLLSLTIDFHWLVNLFILVFKRKNFLHYVLGNIDTYKLRKINDEMAQLQMFKHEQVIVL